jgi:hypothetical protein
MRSCCNYRGDLVARKSQLSESSVFDKGLGDAGDKVSFQIECLEQRW